MFALWQLAAGAVGPRKTRNQNMQIGLDSTNPYQEHCIEQRLVVIEGSGECGKMDGDRTDQ
jgi:hypothetical protein